MCQRNNAFMVFKRCALSPNYSEYLRMLAQCQRKLVVLCIRNNVAFLVFETFQIRELLLKN